LCCCRLYVAAGDTDVAAAPAAVAAVTAVVQPFMQNVFYYVAAFVYRFLQHILLMDAHVLCATHIAVGDIAASGPPCSVL